MYPLWSIKILRIDIRSQLKFQKLIALLSFGNTPKHAARRGKLRRAESASVNCALPRPTKKLHHAFNTYQHATDWFTLRICSCSGKSTNFCVHTAHAVSMARHVCHTLAVLHFDGPTDGGSNCTVHEASRGCLLRHGVPYTPVCRGRFCVPWLVSC